MSTGQHHVFWIELKMLTVGFSSLSHDYSFIVSGSEDKYVYIWSTYHDLSKFTSVRRDRNDFWEGIKGSCVVLNGKRILIYV